MIKKVSREKSRAMRHERVRSKVSGTPEVPRLSVYRTNANISAQVIDDVNGITLASASSLKLENGSNIEAAREVGKQVAEACKKAGISKVVFDRGGYLYHGRVEALAESARENGLEF